MTPPEAYPSEAQARDRWILSRRPPRHSHDPSVPWAFFMEQERTAEGNLAEAATIFLTNRECPWRCLMCDLWQNTLTESVPPGAIPRQIDHALAQPGFNHATVVKLYNSGSFFDARAIPPQDHAAIAERVARFERVVVECHPALVNERVVEFRRLLPASSTLEVAMGLETAHPLVLEQLNKRMTLDQFAAASAFLQENGIALRVFVLVQPPFMAAEESLEWAQRSIDFAFDCGAGVVSLIPTRAGNGAMEALAAAGHFVPPSLSTLEAALAYGVQRGRGRVFADLWNLEQFSSCAECFPARRARLEQMNLAQSVPAPIPCGRCRRDSVPSQPRNAPF